MKAAQTRGDITDALGQPADLSKEVCLYPCADWLKLVSQSEAGEKSIHVFRFVATRKE